MESKFVMKVCESCSRRGNCSLLESLVELVEATPLVLESAGCKGYSTVETGDIINHERCEDCKKESCPNHPSREAIAEEGDCKKDCENCEHREECQKFNDDVKEHGFEAALTNHIFDKVAGDVLGAIFGGGRSRRVTPMSVDSVLQGIMKSLQQAFADGNKKAINVVRMNINTVKALALDLEEAGIVFTPDSQTGLPTELDTPFGKMKVSIEDDLPNFSIALGAIL